MNNLLRYLSQQCKIPLQESMAIAPKLLQSGIKGEQDIAECTSLDAIVGAEIAKRLRRRPSKRPAKRKRTVDDTERNFSYSDVCREACQKVEVTTNRAPWSLAWTYTILRQRYSKPTALSLAYGHMAATSTRKGRFLGIVADPSADERALATSQPEVSVLSIPVPIMRTHTAEQKEEGGKVEGEDEELRAVNVMDRNLKIHEPQDAWRYMKNAFGIHFDAALSTIDCVVQSYPLQEAERMAGSWYMATRPDVENGVKGWGQKGKVQLASVLELERSK